MKIVESNQQLKQVRIRIKVRQRSSAEYPIYIGDTILDQTGKLAGETLSPRARRLCIVSNKKVFSLYGERVVKSFADAGFATAHWLMADGERHKSLRSLQRALSFFSESGLERSDGVVALGGGVVGDLAGFAAALHLRGLKFIQIPTTLLAQIDSSVGGKTGVNTSYGKNLVGAFHQPCTVIIDVETLHTLPSREMTAGMCEAIKQGVIGSRSLFNLTSEALINPHDKTSLIELIAAQCSFKASIVSGDEREDIDRTDYRSRKILNFGHTVGHALETLTSYRYFKHGEAVGYGMIAAAEISNRLGLL
ncbi:MAG: 3-dehydroquinate synthase family protein, partial [Pyrinomonadaceae bacterium]